MRSLAAGHRRATVITVGAGLCTRCVRLGDLAVAFMSCGIGPLLHPA